MPYSRAVYRAGDNHIHEAWKTSDTTGWHPADLSALGKIGVAAAGNPFGYVSPWDNTARVIWRRGHDGHIWELFLQPGGTWKGSDLSAQTSALTAVSDPIAYSSKDRCSVVYRGKQDPGDSAE